jgi:hypothetical protein
MQFSFSFRAVAILLVFAALGGRAAAAPVPAAATRVFAEARAICARDAGHLWGLSLCGPILLVDHTDRGVAANQADAQGQLHGDGGVFRGTLSPEVIIANTATVWLGTRWSQLDLPLPERADERHVMIAHELFHRIQPELRLTRGEPGNQHLDTLEGRYLLQLEWRALARALGAAAPPDRRQAIGDALAFRLERYRRYPDAASEEASLEIAEGVAEYTGVRLGLATARERTAFALHDLNRFVSAPTFVRSFAYATGPAYGLLLDERDPAWRTKLNGAERLDQLLMAAWHIEVGAPDIAARAARYDDGALHAAEVARDRERLTRLAALRASLVDGPVLTLPLAHSNYQFNPQTLVPLEGYGTVYPTMRLTDDWGSLEVESGGALVRRDPRIATVTARGAQAGSTTGQGWRLTLNPGWAVQAGQRPGDLVVSRAGGN